jgi:dTDP-4-dehydrorhamnose 3,5-epimerase
VIDGVVITNLKRIIDARGEVRHGLRSTDSTYQGFGEAYFSCVNQGVVKGWKKHSRMHSNLLVVSGRIRFVLFDDRNESPTRGKLMEFVCTVENYSRLTVPSRIWLAFQGVSAETNLLLNLASIAHDPAESETLPYDSDSCRIVGLPNVDWSSHSK